MKNILIPTDFSLKASYAIHYGAGIAAAMNCGITLMHAYHFPILTEAAVLQESTLEKWEKDIKDELHKIAGALHKKYPDLKIEIATRLGFALDEIIAVAKSHHIDLIVMGSQGAGSLGDNIIGNVTTDIIRESKVPLLIIPPGVSYQAPQRILLACYNEEMITVKAEQIITEIASAFKSELYILEVIREPAGETGERAVFAETVKNHFKVLNPTVHFAEDEKVVHGINIFADKNNVNMVVMLPEKHNFFERMFTEIHTRHMTHDTKRPLIIIPHK